MADLAKIAEASAILADIVREEIGDLEPLERKVVVNKVLKLVEDLVPQPKSVSPGVADLMRPMDENEARRYGMTSFEFGKYRGVPIAEIPKSYLAWLSDESYKTHRALNRYLNSGAVRRENPAEEIYEDEDEDEDDE